MRSTSNPLSAGLNSIRPNRTQMLSYDFALVAVVGSLLMFGLVMIFSASIALPDSPKYAGYSATHFLSRQVVFILIGLVTGSVLYARVPSTWWQRYAKLLMGVAIALLVIVLIPGLGRQVNGAYRWIGFSFFNIQPSEIAKFAMIVYTADFTSRKQHVMKNFRQGFLPMVLVMLCVALGLMLEPDLGATAVILTVTMGILFLGGINLRWFSMLGAALIAMVLALIVLSPWRLERIFAYLQPFSEANALGKGYQLTHSLIAFGRGEWFGVGLGASVEKLHYLPEAHTDFIMAVVGEELGLVGVGIVLALFYFVVRRAFEIGRQSIALEKNFNGLLAKGIGLWIGVQAFINMGVNLGLLPTKGLTLPFMSYGGSGIVVNICTMAVLLRIDSENRSVMRGGRKS